MKEYECTVECYAEDRHRYPVGATRFEEDDYTSDTLDTKFKLVGTITSPKAPPKESLKDGVAAFAKKNNISKAEQTRIYKDAEATEPHEKMRALALYLESKAKENPED